MNRFFSSVLVLAVAGALPFLGSCARRPQPSKPTAEAPPPAPAPKPAAPLARTAARDLASVMAEELKLTDEQQDRVRTLLRGTVQQVNAARTQFANDKPGLSAALTRINAESEGELRQVLTPDQYTQYQAKRAAMRAKMKAKQAGSEK